ncbi:MAG: hypothetical protein COW65_01280 [Cytophagales bacterium CG18_big_fil_WC_8_21_14_2_50_42_9]|nr:MAG: hypothetical protein COW65_01280 [Cytophagales bacterium CG18_big_fil_WC_8_21_14_2_50_42_9]
MVTVLFASLSAFSQSAPEFRILYGKSDSRLLRQEELTGSGSYKIIHFNEVGIRYLRQITGKLYLETGLTYLSMQLKIKPAPMGIPLESRYEDLSIISVPVYANCSLGKYFFVNGGPIIDFQTTENSIDSQSGIGYSLGLGGKYDLNKFSLFINPNLKKHAVIPFKKESYQQRLTEIGIQAGLGFRL